MTSTLILTFGVHLSEAKEWAEKDESAKRFLNRYKNRTKTEYTRALALFFNWLKLKKGIDITPTELLNSQLRKSHSDKIQERRWVANLALDFVNDPEFSDASDTHKRLHWNVIKQFFNSNEVPFSSARNPLGGKSGRRKYKPKPLTREDAKKILACLNQRDRTVALTMIQSGMAIGETLEKFNYMLDYVKAEIRAGAERIKIDFDERKGNGFSYFTYISRDAIQELRKWLNTREKWIRERNLNLSDKAQKAIFINKKGKALTPMKYEKMFAIQLYAKKVKKAPYEKTTHQLRKIFKTESSPPERNIDPGIIEFMMGHIKGLESVGGTYDQSPHVYEKAIEREYEKLEPYINIFSGKATEETATTAKTQRELQELRAQNEKLSARLDQLAEPLKVLKELNSVEKSLEGISEDMERTPLGLIVRYIQLKTSQELYDDVQKLKKEKETASEEE